MKIALYCILFTSVFAYAAENCKPIHESPASISVSGKSGKSTVTANDLLLKGNALSPKQPAEKLSFVSGPFAFSITPVSSCQDGLMIEFQAGPSKKQQLITWDKEIVVDGKAGSESYVIVTAHRIKL
jgi:hypothetical protein